MDTALLPIPEGRRPKFCQECGSKVTDGDRFRHPYTCFKGHLLFVSPQPVAIAIVFVKRGGEWFVPYGLRAIAPGEGQWALPGGFLEGGETVSLAAARELFEEMGALVSEMQYAKEYPKPEYWLHLFFAATIWDEEVHGTFPLTPQQETREVRLFPVDDLPADSAFPEQNEIVRGLVAESLVVRRFVAGALGL